MAISFLFKKFWLAEPFEISNYTNLSYTFNYLCQARKRVNVIARSSNDEAISQNSAGLPRRFAPRNDEN